MGSVGGGALPDVGGPGRLLCVEVGDDVDEALVCVFLLARELSVFVDVDGDVCGEPEFESDPQALKSGVAESATAASHRTVCRGVAQLPTACTLCYRCAHSVPTTVNTTPAMLRNRQRVSTEEVTRQTASPQRNKRKKTPHPMDRAGAAGFVGENSQA